MRIEEKEEQRKGGVKKGRSEEREEVKGGDEERVDGRVEERVE